MSTDFEGCIMASTIRMTITIITEGTKNIYSAHIRQSESHPHICTYLQHLFVTLSFITHTNRSSALFSDRLTTFFWSKRIIKTINVHLAINLKIFKDGIRSWRSYIHVKEPKIEIHKSTFWLYASLHQFTSASVQIHKINAY